MSTQDWVQQVREVLDEGAQSIAGSSASRLNQARQRALDLGLQRRRPRWLWPSFALATAAALMLVLSLTLRAPELLPAAAPAVAADELSQDLDLLAGNEDLEMIENLEFYAWLEQQSLDG